MPSTSVTFILLILSIMTLTACEKSGLQHELHRPRILNDDGDSFTVIAHRGASAYAPENTIAAFQKAIGMEADMIELDVMMTHDSVLVVFHDAELDKLTDSTGLFSTLSLEEVRALEAGSWFGDEYAGEPIPTLEEALEFLSGKISVNIEIKTEGVTDEVRGGVEEKALKLVNRFGMEDQVIFSSFDYRAVRHLKELAPEMPVAVLYESSQSGNKSPLEIVNELRADAFNCSHRQLSDAWLKELTEAGVPINVYTVNDEELMRDLIQKGVSGIFSDKPDVLKKMAAEF